MKASHYIAEALYRRGVRQVFELTGGMITHLLDSLFLQNKIQVVSMHHEQAAAFAAEACARMTGIPGVAMATSGPGATNLLTGIGSCYFDSNPAVFITGQVNTYEQKGERRIRQLGFQETDIVAMAKPVTKDAWRIRKAGELPHALDRAFSLAASGRPGPVLLDVPMDVQRQEICECTTVEAHAATSSGAIDFEPIRAALCKAQRPLILAGGGVRSGRAGEEFRRAVDAVGVPVVHSLMAVDVLPFGHPLRVGMIGTYGNRWANLALSRSDLLIVLGSRLDVRQTGSQTKEFKEGRTIIHVDCEAGEINNRVTGCNGIVAELRPFLSGFGKALNGWDCDRYVPWLKEIAGLCLAWPDTAELNGTPGINPNSLMHRLSEHSRTAAAYVVDVGQHQMWAAQSLEPQADQRVLTSGGMGSMGFALPAGIGAALSSGRRPVVVIAGDGGFQCNIQELQTITRLNLPVKMVIVNNACLGMVRQFQEAYFEARYQSTYWGYSAPDFVRVAAGYGIGGETITQPDELEGGLRRLWAEPDRPGLLQVMIDMSANAYPKIAFGKPVSEMEPFSQPSEMEST